MAEDATAKIVSREAAKAAGAGRFFTGIPCKHGHISERRVSDYKCVVCSYASTERWRQKNRAYVSQKARERNKRSGQDVTFWAKLRVIQARKRAEYRRVAFSLTAADIIAAVPFNKVCPALGIPLVFAGRLCEATATLDRLVPSLGYIVGNIAVISNRANRVKNNVSNADDLRRIADYMEVEMLLQASREGA